MINNFKQFINENNLIDIALGMLDENRSPFSFSKLYGY